MIVLKLLSLSGTIRNLSPNLWKLQHLTSLYLNDNNLTRIPPEICRLTCLVQLDLSCNKLRNLPPEIGELVTLRELLLHNNYIRTLPLEMGKLFKLQILGLKGNPLSTDIMSLFSEVNGTDKILSYLLDNLPSKSNIYLFPFLLSLCHLFHWPSYCPPPPPSMMPNHNRRPLDLNNS